MVFVLLLVGCGDRCTSYWDAPEVEIGIGTRDFLYVPQETSVTPSSDDDGLHFDVALRGYGLLERSGITVILTGFLGEERVAGNQISDVDFRCGGWGYSEATNLRLSFDANQVPYPTEPSEPVDGPVVLPLPPRDSGYSLDSGYEWLDEEYPDYPRDSGYFYRDTGFVPAQTYTGRSPLRIEASLISPSGATATGQTTWLVDR